MRVAIERVNLAGCRIVAAGRTKVEAATEERAGAGQDDGPDGIVIRGGANGCGEVTEDGEAISLPSDFCGGRAIFAIDAVSAVSGEHHDGLYEVNCQIHDPGGQAPPGTSEGVKINARGINFNKHVTGDNLFVMLP